MPETQPITTQLANIAQNIGDTARLVSEVAAGYESHEPGSRFVVVGLQMAIGQLERRIKELNGILAQEDAIIPPSQS